MLNGWVGVKALTVGNNYGTEAKIVMYEALGFSLGTVREVEIDNLSFPIIGHWEGRHAKIMGFKIRSWTRPDESGAYIEFVL